MENKNKNSKGLLNSLSPSSNGSMTTTIIEQDQQNSIEMEESKRMEMKERMSMEESKSMKESIRIEMNERISMEMNGLGGTIRRRMRIYR